MTDKAALLKEAEAAYHRLMTGEAVVEFEDSTGERVRYNQANANRLRSYIDQLKSEISADGTIVRRPMRMMF